MDLSCFRTRDLRKELRRRHRLRIHARGKARREQKLWGKGTYIERNGQIIALSYQDYIDSPEWADKRLQKFKQLGSRCEICGKVGPVDIHHKTYARLGDEELTDLQALCRYCHDGLHSDARVTR